MLGQFTKKFVNSTDGSIAIMTGLTMPVILIISAIAIEASRKAYVEACLSFAVDAAAIAGARYDVVDTQTNALNVFNANFPPGTMGVTATPTVTYDTNTYTVTVTATASMPTLIGSYAGVTTLSVGANSKVQRSYNGLELAMVLDVTGSMASSNKIGGLITAAKSLVDTIYQGQTSRPSTAIAIVPFVTTVNIGSNNTSWLSDPSVANSFPTSVPWAGCVKTNSLAQMGDEDFDTPPPGMKWPTYYAESTIPNPDDCVKRDNDWRMVATTGTKRKCPGTPPATGNKLEILTSTVPTAGPNRSCPPPLVPLYNNSVYLKNYISKLVPMDGGGTMGNLGLVWGGRVLSPSWSGKWAVKQADGSTITGELTQPYNAESVQKAIIMMTDGGSNWYDDALPPTGDPGAYGSGATDRYAVGKLGSTSMSNFTTQIDNKITRLCTALKAKGVKIYTITFMVTDPTVNAIYQNCASTTADFTAVSNSTQLNQIFKQIGQQLQNLKIVG